MDDAKSQLIDRLKAVNSVLITVSKDPSVDQLAACIALTLIINKLNKHGSAVFSGKIPSTIEFLKPEETLEDNPDSLRDFIIALDKNKADKLRYKVEDQMVKIFITPYRTSLNEKDFEFSQGDFNIELVVALGVQQQEDLDQAIVSHGRILHDATVASINTTQQSSVGSINWQDQTASSLCELITDLTSSLGDQLIDEQIATALLTGIIAETDRFSNDKTSPQSMSISAKLMAAGANQQLVSSNLEEPLTEMVKTPEPGEAESIEETEEQPKEDKPDSDGTLNIDHKEDSDLDLNTLPKPSEDDQALNVDDDIPPEEPVEPPLPKEDEAATPPKIMTEPPVLGGQLTANTEPEHEQYDPTEDLLTDNIVRSTTDSGLSTSEESHNIPTLTPTAFDQPAGPVLTPPPPSWTAPALDDSNQGSTQTDQPADDSANDETLDDLEKRVDSLHQKSLDEDQARQQVVLAANEMPDTPQPREDLNANPLGDPLHQPEPAQSADIAPVTNDIQPANNTTGLDPNLFSEPPSKIPPSAVPPVPPPLPNLMNNRYNPDNQTPPSP